MKKLYCFLLYVLVLLNAAMAQEVTVKSFVLAQTDLTAQTEGRKDLNGDACALVKIFLVGDVADVEGNVVKPLVKKNGQTWVFMTQGSKQMQIITQNALPLMVTFADYGIGKLEGNRTYILTLNQTSASTPAPLFSSSVPSNSTISSSASTSQKQSTAKSDLVPSGSEITIPVKDGVSVQMVKVEAGSFMMGATPEIEICSENEKPAHHVTLTNDYYIGKYEVTQALWKAVMGDNPSECKGDDLPVEQVSWDYCQDFILRLNLITGKCFRLPTEAEWEYAARGGKMSRGYQYSGSNTLGDVAWYRENCESKTHAVGTKLPNELGIYDMSGNVWEWCEDWYGRYSDSSQTDPTGALSGMYRVDRGGGAGENAWYCTSSSREPNSPGNRYDNLGLRLVLSE